MLMGMGLYIISLGLGYFVLSMAKKEDKKVLKILGYGIGAIMILASIALPAKEVRMAKKMERMMIGRQRMMMREKQPMEKPLMKEKEMPPEEDVGPLMP